MINNKIDETIKKMEEKLIINFKKCIEEQRKYLEEMVPKLFEKELRKRINTESKSEEKNSDSEEGENWESEKKRFKKKNKQNKQNDY